MPTFKFTARSRPPVPASGQIDYWDETLPGFGMRVSQGGTRTWVVMYRYNGVKRRMKLGIDRGTAAEPVGGTAAVRSLGLADAREAARNALGKAEHGQDPATERRELQSAADDVTKLAKEYIDLHAKPKKRSWKTDDLILTNVVIPAIGRKRVVDVTRADIRSILEPIVARGALTRANHVLEVVRKMFNWSIEHRDAPAANPAVHISPPSKGNSRGRWLKAQEMEIFWKALDPSKIGDLGVLAFKLFALTAQREMEVMKMRWADIDLDTERLWTIPADHAKNYLEHVIPLSPMATRLLRETRKTAARDAVYVFPSPKKPNVSVKRGFVEKRMVKIRKAATIEHFTPHDLRRSVTTYFGKLKVPQNIKKKILNHAKKKKADVTDIYDRFEYLDEKREALEKWETLLLEMVTPPAGANVIPIGQATG